MSKASTSRKIAAGGFLVLAVFLVIFFSFKDRLFQSRADTENTETFQADEADAIAESADAIIDDVQPESDENIGEQAYNYPYPAKKILNFNPAYNSGWIYIAQTVPVQEKTIWLAMVRTLSKDATDKTALLMYGITDKKTGKYYQNLLTGSLSESAAAVNDIFTTKDGNYVRFKQTTSGLAKFSLAAKLPYLNKTSYNLNNALIFKEPLLYESGDGQIPMGNNINSLYASLAPLSPNGLWVDFQKFNAPDQFNDSDVLSLLSQKAGLSPGNPNHRWGSFILSQPAGKLPKGTIGVYWEILDKDGNRQPGGFTNFDLIIPGKKQATAGSFVLKEINCYKTGNKTYLKKWEIIQSNLKVDLFFETLAANQEYAAPSPYGEKIYFYEGAVRVLDSKGKQVGTGMLEQTHNETDDKTKCKL